MGTKEKDDEPSLLCSICIEEENIPPDERYFPVTTSESCQKHLFHFNCLKYWLGFVTVYDDMTCNSSCPICKREIVGIATTGGYSDYIVQQYNLFQNSVKCKKFILVAQDPSKDIQVCKYGLGIEVPSISITEMINQTAIRMAERINRENKRLVVEKARKTRLLNKEEEKKRTEKIKILSEQITTSDKKGRELRSRRRTMLKETTFHSTLESYRASSEEPDKTKKNQSATKSLIAPVQRKERHLHRTCTETEPSLSSPEVGNDFREVPAPESPASHEIEDLPSEDHLTLEQNIVMGMEKENDVIEVAAPESLVSQENKAQSESLISKENKELPSENLNSDQNPVTEIETDFCEVTASSLLASQELPAKDLINAEQNFVPRMENDLPVVTVAAPEASASQENEGQPKNHPSAGQNVAIASQESTNVSSSSISQFTLESITQINGNSGNVSSEERPETTQEMSNLLQRPTASKEIDSESPGVSTESCLIPQPVQDFVVKKVKRYKCAHCDLHFSHSSSRWRHEKTHFLNVSKPCCIGCGKTFTRSYNLKNHYSVSESCRVAASAANIINK